MTSRVELSSFTSSIAVLSASTSCRAAFDEDFEDVCRLRYSAYKREGALPAGAPLRFADRYDDEANTTTYGFYVEGDLAASIRLHIASRDAPEHPALRVFPEHVASWLDAGEVVVDPTRFVVDHEASRLWPRLPYLVVRLAWMAAIWHRSTRLLATVRTEHQAFYRRTFGHSVVAPARPYPSLSKPLSLMAVDPVTRRAEVQSRYPYLDSSEAERTVLFDALAQAHMNLGFATQRLSSAASAMRASLNASGSMSAG